MKGLHTVPLAVLGWLCLLFWFSFCGLYIWFDFNRPHTADASIGRIYSINNHGSIAYLTLGEVTLLYGLAGVSLILALGLFCIDAATRRRITAKRNAEIRASYEDQSKT